MAGQNMAVALISLMLLAVCVLGRMTNALCFAGILRVQQTRTLLWLPLDFTSGCALLIMVSELLLALGMFTPIMIFGSVTTLILLEITLLIFRERGEYLGMSPLYLLAVAFVGLATTYISIHNPGFWDDTSYHLIVSRDLARNGDLTPNLFLRYPFAPFNADIIFALCFFAADFDPVISVHFCQAAASAPLFLLIMLLCSGIHHMTRSGSCVLAGLTLFLALRKTSVTVHIGYAYVDYMAALFVFASFYFLLLIRHRRELWLFTFLGLLLGTAAGCKYQTSAVCATVLLGALIHFGIRGMHRQALCLALSCGAAGSFWYLRNLIQDGNPVDPFLISVFGSRVWSPEDFAANAADIRTDRPRGLDAVIPHTLWAMIFAWGVTAGRWVTMIRRHREGAFSKMRIADWVALGLTVYSLLWIQLFPIPRYLLPAEGILIMYAVVIGHRIFRRISPLAIIPFLLLALAFRLTVPQSDFWKKSEKQRQLFITASALAAPGDRLLTIDVQERNKFFYDGVTVGDLYGSARFQDFYQLGSSTLLPPEEFLQKMRSFGTRRALVSSDVLPQDRVNSYRHVFHFLAETPGSRGGYLMEPLAEPLGCKWLPPRSPWMESYTTPEGEIVLAFAGHGFNSKNCVQDSQFFSLTLKLAETADWGASPGILEISSPGGALLLQKPASEIPVTYDSTGRRIRILTTSSLPRSAVARLESLVIRQREIREGSVIPLTAFLYDDALRILPADPPSPPAGIPAEDSVDPSSAPGMPPPWIPQDAPKSPAPESHEK